MSKRRCPWAEGRDELYLKYHDEEWGVPVYNDKKLFEFIVLESAQAGLSWHTVLKKRKGYRAAFSNFDYKKIAKYTKKDVARLLNNQNIIRNKLKILSTISNAQIFMKIQKEYGSFSNYMWQWVKNKQIVNHRKKQSDIPSVTKLAEEISTDLKKQGFKFFGPTICYAYMQAVGIVNDHVTSCFRHSLND